MYRCNQCGSTKRDYHRSILCFSPLRISLLSASNFNDVGDFHRKFDLPHVSPGINPQPMAVADTTAQFREKFMAEELKEFFIARSEGDFAGMFDALLDLVYVAMGTAHFYGFPWQEGWEVVQNANMAKERAASDGSNSKRGSSFDVVKPEGWTAPDIAGILRDYGWDV